MKRLTCLTLTAILLVLPCQRAKAPVPVFLGLALKCIGFGTIGATAVILYKCEPDYYLVRYRDDGENTYWACSQASARTLKKTGGERCEGPSKNREEMEQRAWENNKDPDHPMYPCGPLGTTLPNATWTNYSIVSIHQSNGGQQWRHVSDVLVEPGEPNWSICVLGASGTNNMTQAELMQVAECDTVVAGGLPVSDNLRAFQYNLPAITAAVKRSKQADE